MTGVLQKRNDPEMQQPSAGHDRASAPRRPGLAHRRAVRIRLGIHPPQLPHLLADAGRLGADHGAMITGQPEQPHAFEGHESRMT